MRTCTIATHPFASATPRDDQKYYFLPFLDHTTLISTNSDIDSLLSQSLAGLELYLDLDHEDSDDEDSAWEGQRMRELTVSGGSLI